MVINRLNRLKLFADTAITTSVTTTAFAAKFAGTQGFTIKGTGQTDSFTGSGNDNVDVSQVGINNWINTGSGNDIVFTGTSNRIILGNDNDVIFAGTGQGGNYVSLGEGKDQLWVSTNDNDLPENLNQINDFNPEDDVIGFANTVLNLGNKGELWDYQQLGNDIIISAFGQEIAQLFNTTITESNFVFFGFQQNL